MYLILQLTELKGRSKGLLNTKFLVCNKDLTAAKGAKNATTFARCLLAATFSEKAQYECSLSGGQYRAGGKGNFKQKPALDQDVVSAIIGKYIFMCGCEVACESFLLCFHILLVFQLIFTTKFYLQNGFLTFQGVNFLNYLWLLRGNIFLSHS